jgi:hypothetical protein
LSNLFVEKPISILDEYLFAKSVWGGRSLPDIDEINLEWSKRISFIAQAEFVDRYQYLVRYSYPYFKAFSIEISERYEQLWREVTIHELAHVSLWWVDAPKCGHSEIFGRLMIQAGYTPSRFVSTSKDSSGKYCFPGTNITTQVIREKAREIKRKLL